MLMKYLKLGGKMRILITGGCGYIGSLAVKKALEEGHQVIVVDDISTGCLEAIEGLNVKLYQVDIRDENKLGKVFSENKIDLVMDFAAKLIVEESIKKPELYYDVNVCGLKNILDCMVQYEVKKIIYSSTAAVYGMLDKKDELINEEDITIPCNPYGTTKLIGEMMIKDYSARFQFDYIIFRYFNVVGSIKYGAKLDEITTIVPKIVNSINTGNALIINGGDYDTKDGTTIRDYIHLEDLVNAHISVVNELTSSNSGIYNLSIGTGTSILELISLTQSRLNKKINYQIGSRRDGDPVISAASNQKFCANFDWKIKYLSIGEMIHETYYSWQDYLS